MIDTHCGAGRRENASFIFAGAYREFFLAFNAVHIGCGTTDISNNTLKGGVFGALYHLFDN